MNLDSPGVTASTAMMVSGRATVTVSGDAPESVQQVRRGLG